MNERAKPYLMLSATLFALVCLAHVARAVSGAPLNLGGWSPPIVLNWIAGAITAALSIWGWSLARRA